MQKTPSGCRPLDHKADYKEQGDAMYIQNAQKTAKTCTSKMVGRGLAHAGAQCQKSASHPAEQKA
jgi:hypothetical protein